MTLLQKSSQAAVITYWPPTHSSNGLVPPASGNGTMKRLPFSFLCWSGDMMLLRRRCIAFLLSSAVTIKTLPCCITLPPIAH